ncbi:MAG: bifunctional riboflavin kinase/FMN adenylyltransferase [Planctomycetota bacterium]|jgi:riboflavin kinase/FMN adenylyltransferase
MPTHDSVMPVRTALTIGNFDGVHGGHGALVRSARSAVGAAGRVVALVFDPHPMTVIDPSRAPGCLSAFGQRVEWLRAVGVDEVIRLEPTRDLLGQSAEAFLDSVVAVYGPDFIVEGPDFRFGRGRRGTVETLVRFGAEHGFETIVIDPVEASLLDQSLVPVRSSTVRWLVERGRVADAARLLGRPLTLRGTVEQGDQRGRELGFPTANVNTSLLLPADGIYAGSAAGPNGVVYPAAISIGVKPTFGERPRACEAHLIGYDGPVGEYGWTIDLCFADWLRDQVAYDGIEPLLAQIDRDIEATRDILGGASRVST